MKRPSFSHCQRGSFLRSVNEISLLKILQWFPRVLGTDIIVHLLPWLLGWHLACFSASISMFSFPPLHCGHPGLLTAPWSSSALLYQAFAQGVSSAQCALSPFLSPDPSSFHSNVCSSVLSLERTTTHPW